MNMVTIIKDNDGVDVTKSFFKEFVEINGVFDGFCSYILHIYIVSNKISKIYWELAQGMYTTIEKQALLKYLTGSPVTVVRRGAVTNQRNYQFYLFVFCLFVYLEKSSMER